MPARPPLARRRTPFVAGLESTYLPLFDVDITETTGHQHAWRRDLEPLRGLVRQMRFPIRWQRVESVPGRYDWSGTDVALEHLRGLGVAPIVDLLHHTSYPGWLSDGLRDPRFPGAFVRFTTAVAERYPWLEAYTLVNEPFSTLHFAGHEALWPPYDSGTAGLVRLLRNVLPALSEAAGRWRELLPDALHVWVDTCEHSAGTPSRAELVALANDRRHVVLDLALGHDLDRGRPYLAELLRAGAEPLLELAPLQVDVLGLDYYAGHEWWYDDEGGHSPSPRPLGFAALAELYADRYGCDVMLGETNLRGLPSDRVSWLKYVLEQYELAVERGVPLRGFCWYPYLDSADWDSLLARPAGRVDPVGVVGRGPDGPVRTAFTQAWEAAAAGAAAADLPAYRFQAPVDLALAGFLPQMAHWDWVDPPAGSSPAPITIDDSRETAVTKTVEDRPATTAAHAPDLVVVSHLRWTWVWQRPQHLVSRFAATRAEHGARTWFVEEPMPSLEVDAPELRSEERDGITRIWLVVPHGPTDMDRLSFDHPLAADYPARVAAHLAAQGRAASPDVLVYTPMAYEMAQALEPRHLAYDVMDDLASFRHAADGMVLRQRQVLAEADVVFTGGRSLHRSISAVRRTDCHLFPSGVDLAHYARAVRLRRPREPKVAGYVGVIDERLDLTLLADLADTLPDWTIRVVGPVAKLDPDTLPQAPNLEYLGKVDYSELPRVMAGFDVALMPFALNEATRSISPTKTLEYLAAGLPVVSSRVPDVVADYSGVVHLADTAAEFAEGCREVVLHSTAERGRRLHPIAARQEWDTIAAAMLELMRPEHAVDSVAHGVGA
jgi:glycosyltransferase involved in cell wall biosynthesis/beta-glucosidase/6-phospho-beta-glucosidase/beta-galactosidase